MADKVLVHLADLEAAAEDVLTDKQEIIDLDRKRNQNREAIRAINSANEKKQYLAMGNCFFQLPTEKAKDLLQKGNYRRDNITQN